MRPVPRSLQHECARTRDLPLHCRHNGPSRHGVVASENEEQLGSRCGVAQRIEPSFATFPSFVHVVEPAEDGRHVSTQADPARGDEFVRNGTNEQRPQRVFQHDRREEASRDAWELRRDRLCDRRSVCLGEEPRVEQQHRRRRSSAVLQARRQFLSDGAAVIVRQEEGRRSARGIQRAARKHAFQYIRLLLDGKTARRGRRASEADKVEDKEARRVPRRPGLDEGREIERRGRESVQQDECRRSPTEFAQPNPVTAVLLESSSRVESSSLRHRSIESGSCRRQYPGDDQEGRDARHRRARDSHAMVNARRLGSENDETASRSFKRIDKKCGSSTQRVRGYIEMSGIYLRPNSYDEGMKLVIASLDRTQEHNTRDIFGVIWKAADKMLRGTWEANMLRPLCHTSEITMFLWKTAVPILNQMLSEVDSVEERIIAGLATPSSMEHVQEMYKLLEGLIAAAKRCQLRQDIDDVLRKCADETIAIFNNDYVCEAVRILCITNLETRLVLRIGIPRMVYTFDNDDALVSEKMDWSLMVGLV